MNDGSGRAEPTDARTVNVRIRSSLRYSAAR